MSERRFLVAPEEIALEPGRSPMGRAMIRGSEHHHLSRVLRLKEGAAVSVFDGRGRGFEGRLESVGRDESRVSLLAPDRRRVEPAFRLTLALGIPHHEKMEWVIQKGTELGVARIVPVVSERSVVRPRGGDWGRLDRWRRTAAEAARQSGRLTVPEIADPAEWKALLDSRDGQEGACGYLFSTGALTGRQATSLAAPPAGTLAALAAVGPEGGFTEAEEAAGIERGLTPVGLGPRVLRAETAGIVAVALILFLAGEMRAETGKDG